MILSNQARCKKCGDQPFSAHRHDMSHCKCGAIAVDGGMEYLRRLGTPENFDDMSIVVDDDVYQELMAAISDPTKNDLGKLCNVARYLRDALDFNLGAID